MFSIKHKKKLYHVLFLLWYYCFTSHDAKTRLFCKIIVLQSTAITSTDSILFRLPPPDFTENIIQQQSLKQFVLHGSCICMEDSSHNLKPYQFQVVKVFSAQLIEHFLIFFLYGFHLVSFPPHPILVLPLYTKGRQFFIQNAGIVPSITFYITSLGNKPCGAFL